LVQNDASTNMCLATPSSRSPSFTSPGLTRLVRSARRVNVPRFNDAPSLTTSFHCRCL
jgi:hypothetical protein